MDISIITTTFNRKDLLRQTIESVQKSVIEPLSLSWEHIVYDDGSTDGTEEMVMAGMWKNVTYIKGAENRGQSYGKNKAITKARGTYILVLDDDNILLMRALHNFFLAAKANPKCNWFVSDFLHADESLTYLAGEDYWAWQFKNPKEMLGSIFKGEHFLQGNVFFKKDLYLEAGKFDETISMAEDLDLYIRFLQLASLPHHIPFVSHLHRIHTRNLSRDITSDIHMQIVKQLQKKYQT